MIMVEFRPRKTADSSPNCVDMGPTPTHPFSVMKKRLEVDKDVQFPRNQDQKPAEPTPADVDVPHRSSSEPNASLTRRASLTRLRSIIRSPVGTTLYLL